jgi:hypothetical protein
VSHSTVGVKAHVPLHFNSFCGRKVVSLALGLLMKKSVLIDPSVFKFPTPLQLALLAAY